MIRFSILLLLVFIACSDDEQYNGANNNTSFCNNDVLVIISDGETCDVESNFLICEILEIEEFQFLDPEAFEWAPDICNYAVGDKIVFRNQGNRTAFEVVENGNYISKERIHLSCNENYEHTTLICQQNEVIYVSFLNELLGEDTLTLALRTMTLSYNGQTPGEKRNIINLWQDRSNSNIRNFWLRHFIGDDYYEQILQTYHEDIILSGTTYKDVVGYEYGAHIHADPDYKYYLQKDVGILGFEVDGKLWLRE